MNIKQVRAREIFNSRGMPTLECEIVLDDDRVVSASVPTGTSRGSHEAVELRDGGFRLMGAGVLKAKQTLEHVIAPILVGREPNMIRMDEDMKAADGTEDKSRLGANTILAASIAVAKAQALVEGVELYELLAHLCEYELVALPYPMFNIVNGGAHARNGLQIQEFMIMPVGVSTFRSAMEIAVTLFHILKRLLEQNGLSTAVGDEGGFAPEMHHETQVLDLIMEAIEYVEQDFEGSIMIALDCAASQFYNQQSKLYTWQGKHMTSQDMISMYARLVEQYPIYAIEDGLSEHDWQGWKEMTTLLGSKIQVVGDDIFCTNAELIWDGIDQKVANTVVIKPNQVGTVTEALQAIKLCKEYDRNIIVSHRSGETNDSFIADLAVGTSAGQIKAGGLSRGERMAKYNRLLKIEDELLQDR